MSLHINKKLTKAEFRLTLPGYVIHNLFLQDYPVILIIAGLVAVVFHSPDEELLAEDQLLLLGSVSQLDSTITALKEPRQTTAKRA